MWRLGASYGFSSTKLDFFTPGDPALGSTTSVSMMKHAVSAVLERRIGDRWSFQLSAGAVLQGDLGIGARQYEILPGPFGTVGGSYRVLDEKKQVPFVVLSASLGTSVTWTRQERTTGAPRETMTAFDGRVGVAAGKTFGGIFSPYVVARGFGLPVLWSIDDRTVTGTDAYHFQLGLGAVLRLGSADIDLEAIPVGERAVVVGGGWSF